MEVERANNEKEIEDAPSTFTADVWQLLGFPVSRINHGKKESNAKQLANCPTKIEI